MPLLVNACNRYSNRYDKKLNIPPKTLSKKGYFGSECQRLGIFRQSLVDAPIS